jgi:hypothetical protein
MTPQDPFFSSILIAIKVKIDPPGPPSDPSEGPAFHRNLWFLGPKTSKMTSKMTQKSLSGGWFFSIDPQVV